MEGPTMIGFALLMGAAVMHPGHDQGTSKVMIEKKIIRDGPGADKSLVDAEAKCGGRKFVADTERKDGGEVKKIKMVICGDKGESNSQWAAKLREVRADAVKSDAPPEMKTQILAQLDAEIARAEQGK